MKTTILILTILTASICSAQHIHQKEFWTKDKQQHLIGSVVVSSFSYLIYTTHPKLKSWTRFQCRAASFLTSTAVGAIWELQGVSSWKDMGANTIGNLSFQAVITVPIHIGNSQDRKQKRINKLNN